MLQMIVGLATKRHNCQLPQETDIKQNVAMLCSMRFKTIKGILKNGEITSEMFVSSEIQGGKNFIFDCFDYYFD